MIDVVISMGGGGVSGVEGKFEGVSGVEVEDVLCEGVLGNWERRPPGVMC